MATEKQHHTTIKAELKSLGAELASALKHVRSSSEVAAIKRDVTHSAKTLAADVQKAVKGAYSSASASKLKKNLDRLATAGKEEGVADLQKAAVFAKKEVSIARKKLFALAKRFKSKAANTKTKVVSKVKSKAKSKIKK